MKPCPYCRTPIDTGLSFCDFCGMPVLDPTVPQLPRGTRLAGGRYTLGGILGKGGFGLTYHGADTILKRPVAIKELFPKGSTRRTTLLVPPESLGTEAFIAARKLFLEEAATLQKFNHTGIVRVWDVFEDNGTAYLVMEYLSGQTLLGRFAQHGKLSSSEALGLTEQILEGLEAMHGAGLLHRDIKPDNIFLTQDGRTVLIDFGAARSYQLSTQRVEAKVTLTHGYAPPEQYTSRTEFGPYTDLYALGATLYHALSGSKPPSAPDRKEGKVLNPLPNTIPRVLQDAILRCLALNPRDRPQSAAHLTQMLKGSSATTIVLSPKDDLQKAIDAADEESVISLLPGDYFLTRRLEIQKSLTLEGAGRDQTRIIGTDKYFVVQFSVGGYFNVRKLTMEHRSQENAHVLTVSAGEVFIKDCRFIGGSKTADWRGTGLYLYKRARGGLIEGNEFKNNAIGIALQNESRPTLISNVLVGNSGDGIAYFDHSGGIARANTLDQNSNGIVVSGDAQPILEDNIIRGSGQYGLLYTGRASGVSKGNLLEHSEASGLVVRGYATPKLERNSIKASKQQGIFYEGNAGGSSKNNTLEGNWGAGILVSGEANPTLERNLCKENAGSGIHYKDLAAGAALNNTTEYNEGDGILLEGGAKPTLEENIVRENEGRGIIYREASGGVARYNLISGNKGFGLLAEDAAHPHLESNTAQQNLEDAVAFQTLTDEVLLERRKTE
jgi:parallel beta-helix repeat protein